MKSTFLLSFILAICFLVVGCISEIEFETEVSGIPIVQAILSNSEGERIIYVSKTTEIDHSSIAVSATGRIFRDGSPVGDLISRATGQLHLPEALVFEEGHSYHIEVQTNDGDLLQSHPQEILPQGRTQGLDWQRTEVLAGVSSVGLPIEQSIVEIYASVLVPDSGPEQFFRWQVDDTWLLREVPRPFVDTLFIYDTLKQLDGSIIIDTTILYEPDIVKECYLTREVSEYPSTILRTATLSPGVAQTLVMTREIDPSFLLRHYFNVYARRIDQRTYEFYEKSLRLIQAAGTLYDEIPAPVSGNVYEVNDTTQMVLGYVEMALADTTRIPLDQSTIQMLVRDDCRPTDGSGIPCIVDGSEATSPPCKCWDCDKVYGAHTLIKPDWWE